MKAEQFFARLAGRFEINEELEWGDVVKITLVATVAGEDRKSVRGKPTYVAVLNAVEAEVEVEVEAATDQEAEALPAFVVFTSQPDEIFEITGSAFVDVQPEPVNVSLSEHPGPSVEVLI